MNTAKHGPIPNSESATPKTKAAAESRGRTGLVVLPAARITRVLLGVTALFVLVHVGAHFSAERWNTTVTRVLVIEFDLSSEENIPTFFSTALLLSAALLLAAASRVNEEASFTIHWRLLSLIFLGLSLDESAGIHEYLNVPFRDALGATGPLYYTWVVPGAVLTAAFSVCYLRFLWHLPTRTKGIVILSGVLYVGGAIGVEMVGAQYYYSYGGKDFAYHLLTAVEESLEMTGVIALMYGGMDYIQGTEKGLEVSFKG